MTSILLIATSFTAYALLHSLLANLHIQGWVGQQFGPAANRWYRLAYNIFAAVSFGPVLLLLVLLPDRVLYTVPAPWSWPMIGGQVLALVGMGRAFAQTDPRHFLGLAQIRAKPSAPPPDDTLQVRGFYCYVRHPLYTLSLGFIWLTPLMTLNMLTFAVLATLYFYAGSMHEEQRLLATFGETYAAYQRRVPRLIPRPGRCWQEHKQDGTRGVINRTD